MDIVKYQYGTPATGSDDGNRVVATGPPRPWEQLQAMSIMTTTPELLDLMERDRVRWIDNNRIARIASRVRDCCRPSLIVRLARSLRGTPAAR
jgi:hypothetical protein